MYDDEEYILTTGPKDMTLHVPKGFRVVLTPCGKRIVPIEDAARKALGHSPKDEAFEDYVANKMLRRFLEFE